MNADRALQELQATLSSLDDRSTTGFRRDANRALMAESLNQLSAEFRDAVDPYGRPWLAAKDRPGSPLNRSGDLMRSWAAARTPEGFVDVSDVPESRFMQFGVTQVGHRTRVRFSKNDRLRAGGFSGPLRKSRARKVNRPLRKAIVPRFMTPSGDDLGNWGPALERVATQVLEDRFGGAR